MEIRVEQSRKWARVSCRQVQEDLYTVLKGWADDDLAREIREHLDRCPACACEFDALRKTSLSLSQMEEIEPSPEVWEAIDRSISETSRPRRARAVGGLIGFAAAASVLLTALSFFLLMSRSDPADAFAATVAAVAPDGTLRVGQTVRFHEPFLSLTYSVLTLPEVGVLRLNRDTRIEFLDRRRVRVLSGEVFAEIEPNGKGFALEGPDATARVLGTRFGMRASERSFVYVVEGAVELSNRMGFVRVLADQAATASPRPEVVEDRMATRHAEWLGAYERPNLWIEAQSRGTAWTAVMRTNSPAPVYLRSPRDERFQMYARIRPPQGDAYVVPLEADAIRVENGLSAPNGLIRLDVLHSGRFSFSLEDGVYRFGPGAYRVSIGYMAAPDRERRDLWSGHQESLAVVVKIGR